MSKFILIFGLLLLLECNFNSNSKANWLNTDSLYASVHTKDSICIRYYPLKKNKSKFCYYDSNYYYITGLVSEYANYNYLTADSLINLRFPNGLKLKGTHGFAKIINQVINEDNKIISDSILEWIIRQIYISNISASRSSVLLNYSTRKYVDSILIYPDSFNNSSKDKVVLSEYQILVGKKFEMVKKLTKLKRKKNEIYFAVFYDFNLDLFYSKYIIKNNKVSFDVYLLKPSINLKRGIPWF